MAPPNSTLIASAIINKLLNDATLMALMPAVYLDVAGPGATKYIIVSLVDHEDVGELQQRAYEDALYLVKAVALAALSTDVRAAADRIQTLLEDQPLEPVGSPSDIPGYSWMTTHRERFIWYTEPDEVDLSQRFQHCGGQYRVQMAVDQLS